MQASITDDKKWPIIETPIAGKTSCFVLQGKSGNAATEHLVWERLNRYFIIWNCVWPFETTSLCWPSTFQACHSSKNMVWGWVTAWQGPLGWSQPTPAQPGAATGGCPGPWARTTVLVSNQPQNKVFLVWSGISKVSVWGHCPLSRHWHLWEDPGCVISAPSPQLSPHLDSQELLLVLSGRSSAGVHRSVGQKLLFFGMGAFWLPLDCWKVSSDGRFVTMSSAESPLQPGPGIYGLDVLNDNAQVSP